MFPFDDGIVIYIDFGPKSLHTLMFNVKLKSVHNLFSTFLKKHNFFFEMVAHESINAKIINNNYVYVTKQSHGINIIFEIYPKKK